MTLAKYRHRRDVQIMPADGWWGVYANEDGTCDRYRIVAFSLLDQWYSHHSYESVADPDNDSLERVVLPLTEQGGYIDHEESENYLGCIHADEWAVSEPGFKAQAEEYARKRVNHAKG